MNKPIWELFPKENINILFNDGGLGDHVARMPAIKYAINKFPYITFHLWVPDFFLDFAKNLLPNANIKPYSKKHKWNDSYPCRVTTGVGAYTNLRSHMTDHAFQTIINETPSIEYRNYLKLNVDKIKLDHIELPEKYVVVTTGFTAPIREWPAQYINEVVHYINSKGYEVVFLGKTQAKLGHENMIIKGNFSNEVDYSKGLNLIDKTNLLQAGKIIAKAKAIVGLDNGLLHVAGCTDTPIVGAFTSVSPHVRMAYRQNELGWNYFPVVPPDTEPERFFQSEWDFLFYHDFKESFLKDKSTLVQSVTPDLYIKQLERIL